MTKPNALARRPSPSAEVPADALGDMLTVRGKLALLGWSTLQQWSNAHGYERQMAGYVIRTWGLRTDRTPHGGISRAVLRDLRSTLAKGLRPEHVIDQWANQPEVA